MCLSFRLHAIFTFAHFPHIAGFLLAFVRLVESILVMSAFVAQATLNLVSRPNALPKSGSLATAPVSRLVTDFSRSAVSPLRSLLLPAARLASREDEIFLAAQQQRKRSLDGPVSLSRMDVDISGRRRRYVYCHA